MDSPFESVVARELGLPVAQVARTLALLDEGASVPFLARYRKEQTGSLDEVQIANIGERAAYLRELSARQKTVLAQANTLPAGLPATDEARAGARDIVAEMVSERADVRLAVRTLLEREGQI